MVDNLSLTNIETGQFTRSGELLIMKVKATALDEDHDFPMTWEILVKVPCELIRDEGAPGACKYVSTNLAGLSLRLGPISHQRLSEAVTDRVMRTNLKALAGEMFLLDMIPAGNS